MDNVLLKRIITEVLKSRSWTKCDEHEQGDKWESTFRRVQQHSLGLIGT